MTRPTKPERADKLGSVAAAAKQPCDSAIPSDQGGFSFFLPSPGVFNIQSGPPSLEVGLFCVPLLAIKTGLRHHDTSNTPPNVIATVPDRSSDLECGVCVAPVHPTLPVSPRFLGSRVEQRNTPGPERLRGIARWRPPISRCRSPRRQRTWRPRRSRSRE